MSRIKCFLLEPSSEVELSLRRYRVQSDGDGDCAVSQVGYHDARAIVERVTIGELARRGWPMHEGWPVYGVDAVPHVDPRWPRECACGYVFTEEDTWQCNPDQLWRRSDTGEMVTLGAAPAGAMWFASWLADHQTWCGPDGRSLHVRTPGGDWCVDARASNCTCPEDKQHKCWVRHGEAPDITVDKNGLTCAAGGGSIISGAYHGFLREGWLEAC